MKEIEIKRGINGDNEIQTFTTEQIKAFTDKQISEFTVRQILHFTKEQIQAFDEKLQLDNNTIKLINQEQNLSTIINNMKDDTKNITI